MCIVRGSLVLPISLFSIAFSRRCRRVAGNRCVGQGGPPPARSESTSVPLWEDPTLDRLYLGLADATAWMVPPFSREGLQGGLEERAEGGERRPRPPIPLLTPHRATTYNARTL